MAGGLSSLILPDQSVPPPLGLPSLPLTPGGAPAAMFSLALGDMPHPQHNQLDEAWTSWVLCLLGVWNWGRITARGLEKEREKFSCWRQLSSALRTKNPGARADTFAERCKRETQEERPGS